MPEERIQLVEPTEELRGAYIDFMEDFRTAGEPEPHGSEGARDDFSGFLGRLRDEAKGVGLPEGWVPASMYWLVSGGRILGTCGLRHRLTEALRDYGGHIGYSVRPSERQKGYATLMLKLVLEKARQLGIRRALITCDRNNIASARVIQKNGGVLDSEGYSPRAGRVTQRYWIDL
jgi:predicted acetyltransferase